MIPPRLLLPVILCFGSLCLSRAHADDPLSVRIDQLIDADQVGPSAVVCNDAEFLRRAMLDLHGLIPTSAEARAFLDDASPSKRTALIERLVASPRFAVHMATVLDVMLMERRADKYVSTPEWQKYLQTALERNVPFDQLARDILSSDGVDANLRPAAKFFLDRDAEPHLMTRDIGRVFFGMDLQCAQCHDHPIVDHYLQTDYYGIFAFVNRTVLFTDVEKKVYLGEKSDGDASYKSVFTQDAGNIRPQLPGEMEIDEPRLRQGEDYIAPPLPNSRPVPKFSRRNKLAELAANSRNRQFNLNIANRLWAHMMGRGLVHPVDLHHPLNPPSHPAVLELVTSEFVAMKYDIRTMLRELALTQTYQRSIEPPSTQDGPQLAKAAEDQATLTAVLQSLKASEDASQKLANEADSQFKSARTALAAAETAWRTSEAAVATAKKPLDDSMAAVDKAQADARSKEAAIKAITETSQKSAEVAKLLPNDKEIASAVATFTAKQTQLTTELQAVQKSIADQTATQAPLQAKLVEAYPPADAAYAAYLEARKPVDAAKAKFIEAWNRYKADSLATANCKKRLTARESQVALKASLSKVEVSRAEVEAQKAALGAAVAESEAYQVELSKLSNVVGDVEKAMADAQKLVDEAKSQLDGKRATVQNVADAIAKTEAALQMLPGDADLTQAVQKLKERLEPLKKEADTLEQATAGRTAAQQEVVAKLAVAKQSFSSATAEMANRQAKVTAKTNEMNQALEAQRSVETAIATEREKLVDQSTVDVAVRSFKQLSPEQLGWTLMQATGVLESQRIAADGEVEKSMAKASVAADATQAKIRDFKLEQQFNEQMRGNVAPFINLYAASSGQSQEDFFATPDQALFVANGGTLVSWASGGQLAQRLTAMTDNNTFAEELYLSTLTRRPAADEVNEVAAYLTTHANERPQAIRDLIWSLVTSAEFRFNH